MDSSVLQQQLLETLYQRCLSSIVSCAGGNELLSLSCSELILSGSSLLHYEGNTWVMYLANDSVAGVFKATPQSEQESSPSTAKEATAHTDKEAETLTNLDAKTGTDNDWQVCGLIEQCESIIHSVLRVLCGRQRLWIGGCVYRCVSPRHTLQ